MRFVALHQRSKRSKSFFFNFSFKNALKTITAKSSAKQSPVLKNANGMKKTFLDDLVEVNQLKYGKITKILINGLTLRKGKNIVIMNKENTFMRFDGFAY